MYNTLPCERVLSISAGHASSFLTQVNELVKLLNTL